MGLESQQERFKRLTLVSNSMGPVTAIFQDGILYMLQKEYIECVCMRVCRLPAEMLVLTHMGLQFSQ